MLNLVEFGCVGAEIKWDTVWFVVCGFVVCGLHRKIRLIQLWVELIWVVAIEYSSDSGWPRRP